MRRPFYSWLMTEQNPTALTDVQQFANGAFYDLQFPKQSQDFDELSNYLEVNAPYLHSMTTFDEAWEMYQASEG